MAKVFSIAKVSLNGVDHRTMSGSSLTPGGVARTSQYGSGVRVGTSEEPVGSRVTVKFHYLSDTDVLAIRNFTDGQCQVVTDVGHVWDIPNASVMNPPEIGAGGEGISVEIEGDEATLIRR